ncbi:tyrosinase family protein [Nonomuraea typhae]|uniref:Tyrosinase family protein n=1 Tax=Nonomuraea typhae TaxID=2603600 RepID=A0ABW7YV31_9ACTN
MEAVTMGVRKNITSLTADERKRFTEAVVALKNGGADRYEPFVKTHVDFFGRDPSTGINWAHQAPTFLPWHRRYLLEFERSLQSIDPTVSLPYWDWTTARSTSAFPWTDDFLGRYTAAGPVTTGPFRRGVWNVDPNNDQSGLTYIRRALGGDNGIVTLPTAAQVTTVQAVTPYDTAYGTTSTGYRNQSEGFRGPNLHNRVHNWVGGTMPTTSSTNDPVFWLHHCFVDKLWADWQTAHPGIDHYQPTGAGGSTVVDLNEQMRPWNDADSTPASLLDWTKWYTYQ